MIKSLHIGIETTKTLKRGKMKNEKHEKSLNKTKTIKFFTYIFCI